MATVTEVLDTVDTVMTKIAAIGQLPGVSLIPYVSTAASIINTVHMAYVAEKDIAPFLANIKNTYSQPGLPSEQDIADLKAQIAVLRADEDDPLPPKEDGEPD